MTARDGTTPRPYSNPAQELKGELNLEVTQEMGRFDGAMGRGHASWRDAACARHPVSGGGWACPG